MATPEATFFVFLFRLSLFHLFTANVTQALPLETIKGETRATSRTRHEDAQDFITTNRNTQITHKSPEEI
jgi:hypothetical protein